MFNGISAGIRGFVRFAFLSDTTDWDSDEVTRIFWAMPVTFGAVMALSVLVFLFIYAASEAGLGSYYPAAIAVRVVVKTFEALVVVVMVGWASIGVKLVHSAFTQEAD